RFAVHAADGVDFSKNTLLRAGIVLYGFRISFQQIAGVGWAGVIIDALIIGLTFTLAVQLGTRVFKLDRQTAMLIGAGSSICGAAAVMATEPVVRGQEHKVSVAVATVVIFGTIAMFAYPLVYPYLGLSEQAYGIFAGSTIHEVAQVVAAGNSVSAGAANTAVIEKMLRVMMLAPFLVMLSGYVKSGETAGATAPGKAAKITIPWFALFFVGASAIHSTGFLPAALVDALVNIDTALLAMAMAALGLRTNIGAVRQAGLRPILLAAVLFSFLTVGGYGINYVVRLIFA
ncbi:YeiH family protein, partial [Undibacterium sp.]|uniref:YeiH family protein n=1 Tax=Undibacterium sp. TaxID=1914977 RepID=UPI00374D5736